MHNQIKKYVTMPSEYGIEFKTETAGIYININDSLCIHKKIDPMNF
jgi:hypothetical protein